MCMFFCFLFSIAPLDKDADVQFGRCEFCFPPVANQRRRNPAPQATAGEIQVNPCIDLFIIDLIFID